MSSKLFLGIYCKISHNQATIIYAFKVLKLDKKKVDLNHLKINQSIDSLPKDSNVQLSP